MKFFLFDYIKYGIFDQLNYAQRIYAFNQRAYHECDIYLTKEVL